MKCEECLVEMDRKSHWDYRVKHWDKHGAITLRNIEVDVCSQCKTVCPRIYKFKSLMELLRQYPGVRQFRLKDGEWTVPEWLKSWKLKTDLKIGDSVLVEREDGTEPCEVVGVESNRFGYDILKLKSLVNGRWPDMFGTNHNRCRKMED